MELPKNLFTGYVPLGKSKAPTMKYKGKQLMTLDEVKDKNFGGVMQKGYVMVDIDDTEKANILLNIITQLNLECHIQETTRGYHFYFLNDDISQNRQKALTAIGITVEHKVNENTLVPIVIDGVFRNWTQISENVETIPIWLKHTFVASEHDFFDLGEGGRNDTFFKYQGALLRQGFNGDDVIKTINIINQYILSEPMEQKEIDTILRDANKEQERTFFIKKQFMHNMFGNFLLGNETIVKIENRLHIQLENYLYSSLESEFERIMIKRLNIIRHSQRQETYRYLGLVCNKHIELTKVQHIPLKTKVYDLETEELIDYNRRFVFKNKINYDIQESHELVEKVLDKVCCYDKNLRLLVEEMIGYMMFRRNELRKSFILVGEKQSGKSTILKMISKLFGKENISALSLKDLGHTFRPAQLDGKMVNIGDDIDDNYIEDDSMFKKLVSGEMVTLEKKGKDPFEYLSTVKFLFSANKLPKINDKGDGFISRVIIIPFNANITVKDEDFDPFIEDKVVTEEALGYFLKLGLKGLKRVLQRNAFTSVDVVEDEIQKYRELNNPILLFIADEPKIENEITSEVYRKYTLWCAENGYKPLSNVQFSREICKKMNFTTDKTVRISDKKVRLYTKKPLK